MALRFLFAIGTAIVAGMIGKSVGSSKRREWIGSIAALGGKEPFKKIGDVATMLIADPRIPGQFDGYDLDGNSEYKIKFAPAAWADVKFLGMTTLKKPLGLLPSGAKLGYGRILSIKTYELTSESSPAGKPRVGDTVYFD